MPDAVDWLSWTALTRLGEGPFLMPVLLIALARLLQRPPTRRLVLWWLGLLAAAIGVTVATKLAFLGWGLGVAAIDFTGISGHSMFAACVYPLLGAGLATPRWRLPATLLGGVLAVAIGVSRLEVHVHSVSEVVAGLLLGAAVTWLVLRRASPPQRWLSPVVPLAMLVWLWVWAGATPGHGPQAPSIQTHALITRLAVQLSGRSRPYDRCDLQRNAGRPVPAACDAAEVAAAVAPTQPRR